MLGTLRGLPVTNRRKVGMTSSQYAPYAQGYTHATMGGTAGSEPVRGSESLKAALSSDRGLQLALVKAESLVSKGHHGCKIFTNDKRWADGLNAIVWLDFDVMVLQP